MRHATAGLRRALERLAEGQRRARARSSQRLATTIGAAHDRFIRRWALARLDESWSHTRHHRRWMARPAVHAGASGEATIAPVEAPGEREATASRAGHRPPVGLAAEVGLLAVAVALGVVLPAAAPAVGRMSPAVSPAPHIAVLRAGLGAEVDSAARDGGAAGRTAAGPTGGTAGVPTTSVAADVLAGGSVALAILVAGPAAALPPDARAEVVEPARLDCVLAALAARCGPDGIMEAAAPLVMATYRVQEGDTLYTIAAQFGLHFGTLWWANKLDDPRTLHIGQTLRIPPVDGVVYTFRAGDTLDSVAAHYGVSAADIIEFNALTGDDLPVGTTIMVPDASGPALPKPKAVPATAASRAAVAPAPAAARGTWLWPVPGGWISQYYHASHPALDIAAPMGRVVIAAAAGRVIFAGWKDNGGGYQVWVSHGHDLFTTYNHMELVSVRAGQSVAAGQQVGRVGMTGNATGPHCHFEVWIGPIWDGGYRVNPLNYVR